MTQKRLAKKAGIVEQTVKNFEKGRTWGQDYTVSAIAKALNIKVWELYVPKNVDKRSFVCKS
jgi:DNA-binding XRE family transcriptional regulator